LFSPPSCPRATKDGDKEEAAVRRRRRRRRSPQQCALSSTEARWHDEETANDESRSGYNSHDGSSSASTPS
jgi:hypothetical protein